LILWCAGLAPAHGVNSEFFIELSVVIKATLLVAVINDIPLAFIAKGGSTLLILQ
jgi:cell division protein FtsW (lipid II flippase)